MLSRRDLVGRFVTGTAMAWAAIAARASFASTPERATTSTEPFFPVPEGDALAAPQAGPRALETGPVAVDNGPVRSADGPPIVDHGSPATGDAPPPWDLLRPLAIGSAVAHGWRVAGLTGVVDGCSVLTLENRRGRSHRVHLCRNEGRPQGLVYTERVDLVAMNGGQGDLPTEESFAQAVAEVAHVLAANEKRSHAEPIVTALLPHAERVRLFAGDADRRLR